MMRFDILTLFPEVFSAFNYSIIKNACDKGILEFNYINIRDFSNDKHKRVDDYTYGGGAGMLMQPQPIYDAYQYVLDNSKKRPKTIYLSPRGKVFNQQIAKELAKEEQIVLICGHYEGIDQRIIDEICDYELSIGDFVLTGGEQAAIVVCDAVSRLVPGVLSGEESYTCESHYNNMLEFEQYTRPPVFHDVKVPDVLLSGNQKLIDKWRDEKSYEITLANRPDLLNGKAINKFEPPFESKYALYYFGENLKTFGQVVMQLEKGNIKPNKEYYNSQEFDNTDNYVIIYDGVYNDFDCCEKNIYAVKLKSITGFDNLDYNKVIKLDDVLATDIACKVKEFLTAVYISKQDELLSCFVKEYKFKIVGNIPLELYENHKAKFEKYEYDDILVIDKELDINEITALSENNLFKADVLTVKSKKTGKKTLILAKNIKQFIKDNNFNCSDITGVEGDYLNILKKTFEIKNIDVNVLF